MPKILHTVIALCFLSAQHPAVEAAEKIKIVLIAGETKKVDRIGHHDYLGGCRLLQNLLQQSPQVEALLVKRDWPSDESIFDGANAVVFYTDGGGKQAYLKTPERIAIIHSLAEKGAGIVSIHQAVDFPVEFFKQSAAWTGATYAKEKSGRGHWDSEHNDFPDHPATRGVTPWKINDGWLNGFTFTGDTDKITPLVWSGKNHAGSQKGGMQDVVAWAYDRPDGGRSFNFTGLDAHSAFEKQGVTKLVVNGILWSAGRQIPKNGAHFKTDKTLTDSFLTPRIAPKPRKKK